MVETLTGSAASAQARPAPAPERKTRDDDAAAGFSFPAALSALEARASAALNAFGGTPENASPANAGAPRAETQTTVKSDKDQNAPSTSAADETGGEADARPQQASERNGNVSTAQALNETPAKPVRTAPSVSLNDAATGLPGAAAPAQTNAAVSRAETGAVREVQKTDPGAARVRRPQAPVRPQAAMQTPDFARLIAHRLKDGKTHFELRLDPPDLGRVEARLTIADDGKAALALKFDNQAALDHFARDGEALRQALLTAGFDLGGQSLSFTLAERGADEPNAFATAPAIVAETSALPSYEPLFYAPFSQGVVDLRI